MEASGENIGSGGGALLDSELTEELYETLGPAARTWTRGELGRYLEAADLQQEAILEALERRKSFRGKTLQDWRLWLGGILRNKARNALRKAKLQANALMRQDSQGKPWDMDSFPSKRDLDTEVALERIEASATLLRVMESCLEPAEAVLLRLRYFHGHTLSEIGELFGISVSAVQRRISRSFERIVFHMNHEPYFRS